MQGERTAARARPSAPSEALATLSAWVRGVARWIAAERVDIAIAVSITVVAAVLRFWDLGGMPPGLHGDEAWTGLDARRILDEGSIGPYVDSALGQPTGPLYFVAFLFTFMPESTWTVRFAMALIGVASIPAAYLAFASMFNRTTGAFAAAILATMTWHLHLSRTGFMVISWTLMEMLTLWVLWQAFKRRSIWLFLVSGFLLGLGVYTYNAYLLFVPVPFVALAWMGLYALTEGIRRRHGSLLNFVRTLGRWRGLAAPVRRDEDVAAVLAPQTMRAWQRYALMCAGFALAALLAAMPLYRYYNEDPERYRGHQRGVSLMDAPRWDEADGVSAKSDLLWERAKEWHEGLVRGGIPDFGDGLGVNPSVDPLIHFFAVIGILWAIWNIRRPQYATLLAALLLLPLGALLTVDAGLYRRTLGLAPFVAVLAALPLARIWDGAWRRDDPFKYALLGIVLLVPLFAGIRQTRDYFSLDETQEFRYVYVAENDAASHYIDDLPDGTTVYFYSDRWSFDYETRRFIAPDAIGIDRSKIFRRPEDRDSPIDLSAEEGKDVAFLFLAPYMEDTTPAGEDSNLAQVQERYPGGVVEEKRNEAGALMYQGYYLDR